MAFDKTLPTNSTKIKNYPTVLTNNFAGIQTGDETFKVWQLNFADRNQVAGAPPPTQDPTRIDDTMIVFSKDDPDGETELFIIDDRSTANNFQITQNGALGSTTTPLNGSSLSMDVDATTGLTYVDGQFITAYGFFNSAGILQFGKNMATSGTPKPFTGEFNIDVNADVLQNANYIVNGTVKTNQASTSGSVRAIEARLVPAPVASTVTTIKVQIRSSSGTTNSSYSGFYITICGGR